MPSLLIKHSALQQESQNEEEQHFSHAKNVTRLKHKEPLITRRRALLAALVSRCCLYTKRWPARDEHVATLEAYEAPLISW